MAEEVIRLTKMNGLREKSVLGPSGPRDRLFKGQIESELMWFLNLFINHKQWNNFDKIAPTVLYFSAVIMISYEAFLNF